MNLPAGKGDDGKVVVTSIRLDTTTHARLKEYAKAERRSVSQQLRVLIDRGVAEHEQKEAA